MAEFVYRVDADDKIVFVDTSWNPFAIANGLPHLTAEAVVGNPLWNYLTDLTTRHLYRIFMHRARTTGEPVSVPFRCDAPDRRRFMRMMIVPTPDLGLEFRSCLLREEARPAVALLDSAQPRRTDYVKMCSWCKKIEAPDWVEVEEGVKRLKLFEANRLPWVTHSICPDCEHGLNRDLA